MTNYTTIATRKAIVNGKKVTVDVLYNPANRQELTYKVGNSVLSADSFWALAPKFSAN